MANLPSTSEGSTESKEGFAKPVSYKGYVPGTFGVSMSKGAPVQPAILGIPKVGIEIKSQATEKRARLVKAVEEAGFEVEIGEDGKEKLIVPEEFMSKYTEPYEQELALNEAMKNVQMSALRRTVHLSSDLTTLQTQAFEVSSSNAALRPELDTRISKLKVLLDDAAAGNVEKTNELQEGIEELKNYIKLAASSTPAPTPAPVITVSVTPTPTVAPQSTVAPIAVAPPVSTPQTAAVPTPEPSSTPTPSPIARPTPTPAPTPSPTLRPTPKPTPAPSTAPVVIPTAVSAPVKAPEPAFKVETLVPERFEVGQVFFLPNDETSSEAHWQVMHVSLEREGMMTLRQMDGTAEFTKIDGTKEKRTADGTEASREEVISTKEFKKILGDVQLERQRAGWAKANEEKEKNKPQPQENTEEKKKVLRPTKKTQEAQLEKKSEQGTYFTPGDIITLTREGQGPEEYRVGATEDGKVTVRSMDHREKGDETIDVDELKKLVSMEKTESPERLSLPPLRDLFIMFNKKNGYSAGGILAWKKKWFDSGEIDTYRKNYTNVSISDEQIEDARKAIELYAEVLQTKGITRELSEDATTNIVINARILTGVHHPVSNDIEYFVNNKVLNGGHLEVVRASLNKIKGAGSGVPQEQNAGAVATGPAPSTTVPLPPIREAGEDWSYVDMAEGRTPTGTVVSPTVPPAVAGAPQATSVPSAPSVTLNVQPAPTASPSSPQPAPQPSQPTAKQEKMKILEKVNKLLNIRLERFKLTKYGGSTPLWLALAAPVLIAGTVLYEFKNRKPETVVVPPTASAPQPTSADYTNWRAYLNTGNEKEVQMANDIVKLSRQELAEKYIPSYVKKGDTLAAGKLFSMDNADNIISPNVEHIPGLTDEQRREIHTFIMTTQKVAQSMLAASEEKTRQNHTVYALEGVDRYAPTKKPFGPYLDSIKKAETVLQS